MRKIIILSSIGMFLSIGFFFSNSFQSEETSFVNNTEQDMLNSKIMTQYQKINEGNFWNMILAVIAIGTSSGAFIFAYKGDQEIKNLIHKLGFDIENILTGSGLKIQTSNEYYELPIAPSKPLSRTKKIGDVLEKVSNLLEQIGQEKLSALLQRAMILSVELKDDEMKEWLQDELDGYQRLEEDPKKKRLLKKNPPSNRIITGHFFLGTTDHSIKPVKIPKQVFMNKSIAEIEDIVKRHDEGKVMTTLPYTIKEDVEIKGEKVDLLLPREEWKKIIFSTERKLSSYLESHLLKK